MYICINTRSDSILHIISGKFHTAQIILKVFVPRHVGDEEDYGEESWRV